MESLVGRTNCVVTEKYEFVYRKKPKRLNNAENFLTFGIMMEGSQNICFSAKSSYANVDLSSGTSMEQIKLLVFKKCVFKYRQKSL